MLKKLITITAFAVALPAAAQQSQVNPSRPDLNQPSAQTPASDQQSRDIQNDRGFDQTGAGSSTAPVAAPVPQVGAREGEVGGLTDAEIFSRLHGINQQEIDLANVALQKGKMPEVKSFAQMMIKDHQKADADLQKFAKDHSIAIREPQPLNDGDRKDLQGDKDTAMKVRNAGADFDSVYANAMLQGHADAIAMVETAAAATKSAPVKGFYEKLLPTLRMHRDHAADIVATIQTEGVGGTSGSTGAGTSEDSSSPSFKTDAQGNVMPKSDVEQPKSDQKIDQKSDVKDSGKKSDSHVDE